jgi:signal transduction histidine kinase
MRAATTLGAQADSLRQLGLDSLAAAFRGSASVIRTYAPVEIAAVGDGETALADRTSEQQVVPAIDAIQRILARAEQRVRERSQEEVTRVEQAAAGAYRLAGILALAAALASLAVAVWLTRSIARPVADLEEGMDAVAKGDFDHRLETSPHRTDEFGRLAASYVVMAEQLAELSKLRAEFVSVASHELKTPINVILGYLKLLEENLYGPLSDKQSEVIGTLQGQAEALGRLTQHLLDVSRFQAGAGRLELRPIGLRAFLNDIERTFGVLAVQRGITFFITTAPDIPDVVSWDLDRVQEVMGNLLTNAFKFTDAGGRVEIVATPIEGAIYFEVRDTGAGIAPEQLAHIFDKFFQADNQEAAATKGTGLGLAIAKEIVEAHGGSIAVESRKGEGTKFSIVLPVDPGRTAGGAEAADDGTESAEEMSSADETDHPAPAPTAAPAATA